MYNPMRSLALLLSLLIVSACSNPEPAKPDSPLSYDLTGPKNDTLLVFIHGWLCDRSYWQPQVEHFEKDYRVLNVDLMSHGESLGDDLGDSRTTIEALAADVAPIVRDAKAKRVVLIGHSMGGNVVVELASLLPKDQPVLVVGVDTLREPNEPTDQERLDQTMAAMNANFEQTTIGFVSASFFVPGTDPEFVSKIATDMAQGPKATGMELINALVNHDLPQGLRNMADRPLVVINSSYLPTDLAGLKQHHPNVTLLAMENVGHFLHLEQPRCSTKC